MPLSPPILIASPVRRSGTTLLQRLLCSSDNALIYGESCAGELQILLNVMVSKQLYFKASQSVRDEMLQKLLKGEVNDWIPDLMPELTGYFEALPKHYLSIFEYYQNFAKENNRPLWGMKMAEWQATQIRQSMQLIPGSKLLYIVRDLENCVRSAKRVNMLVDLPEIQQFCQIWQQNMSIIQGQIPAESLLMIDYQALEKDPVSIIQQIESFTGIRGIKASVMDHRINTFKSDLLRDASGQGYLTPSELTEEEIGIINTFNKPVV